MNPTADANVEIQRQQGVLHWKDLCYDISINGNKRQILDHVNGWVKPGTLTALMVRTFLSRSGEQADIALGCDRGW